MSLHTCSHLPLSSLHTCSHRPLSSLQDVIDRGHFCADRADVEKGPNMAAVLATAAEMAAALSFLHASNVVHGDLSGECEGGKCGAHESLGQWLGWA